jgi:DNA-binding NarL/FixJ family response regulator
MCKRFLPAKDLLILETIMIRVAITDDNPKILITLRLLLSLSKDMELVCEAHNGQEAIDCAKTLQPDVLVMDVHMPVLDGFTATKKITKLPVCTRVILISLDIENATAARAAAVGAQGFIPKDDVAKQLLPAIETVSQGETFFVE